MRSELQRYKTMQKTVVTDKISVEDIIMMNFILSLLERKLAKKKAEVTKLRWKKVRLEEIKRRNQGE